MRNLLENRIIKLRALEPSDVALLYDWENNTSLWILGSNLRPFSKNILEQYVENSHLDIYEAKQQRFMIDGIECKKTVGTIDLFDFDPTNKRAGVGIYIHEDFRQNGFATEALELLKSYTNQILGLHQLHAEMLESNKASYRLFANAGFNEIGVKKDWVRVGNAFENEIAMQFIF